MGMQPDIRATEIEEVLEIKSPLFRDERGYFAEVYSADMWRGAGFTQTFVQDNLSLSAKGVIRGLHYQLAAHGMGKLVRVLSGAVFDVAVDLRRGSPTFGQWVGRTLSAENAMALWVPAGFAHGFAALEDNTLVLYKCTSHYEPKAERALRFNDPSVGVAWPVGNPIVSPKDSVAPLLDDAEFDFVYVPGPDKDK